MIIVDVETTGLEARRHSIVSIGALDFSDPENDFYGEARPFEDAEITEQALEINGFNKEELKAKEKSLEELIGKFVDWTQGINSKVLAGQNVGSFDIDFLKETMKRVEEEWLYGYRFVDLHSGAFLRCLAKEDLQDEGTSDLGLNVILNYVGLPDEPEPHDALQGAECEAEAFSRLVLKEKLLEEFDQYSIPEGIKEKVY